MIKSEYKIGRIWGIPIKIHISMLILLVYLVLYSMKKSADLPELLLNSVIILSSSILLFVSIALHELGHSYVAIRKGCRVYEITLMFMGGAAKMNKMPERPADEILMALAGPAVSLVIGTVATSASLYLIAAYKLSVPALLVVSVLLPVGVINLILTAFNLIPAFPMDGGRVFRAMLTKRLGRLQATFVASRLGRVIAVIFVIVGIFGLKLTVYGIAPFPPNNFVLIVIAFFVYSTADREYRMVQYEELMKQRYQNAYGCNRQHQYNIGETPVDDDSVIISPPPYEKGPVSRTKLQVDKKPNPLERIFGRKFRR